MIHYNPLFHQSDLKLLLPQEDISNIHIHNTLLTMGYNVPKYPDDQEVIAYILPPMISKRPCSFIVVKLSPGLTEDQCYKAGVTMYDSFDFDELDYEFFNKHYCGSD